MFQNIAIIGSSGAIGSAFVEVLAQTYPEASIHAFSRSRKGFTAENVFERTVDYNDEASLAAAAEAASQHKPLDLVLVATGLLHNANIMPEKSMRDLSAAKFADIFAANTILPALLLKHFAPKLNKESRSVFAALSARVGSISDNQLGGWYAYRASKAALNMIIKNTAIEMARQNRQAVIIGLHPGTVDSPLSQPFQKGVPAHKLFTPTYAAQQLIEVVKKVQPADSGKCFAWDGSEITP